MIQRLCLIKVSTYHIAITLEVPRHQSKILANVKKEDQRPDKRAQLFLADSLLKKGGSIDKKDLSIYYICD